MEDAVLAEAFPPLARWVRGLGLDRAPGLAHYFTAVELGSGAAALQLSEELGVTSEADFVELAQSLDLLVEHARRRADARRRGFVALGEHSFHFERILRQRNEAYQASVDRLRDLEHARDRADVPALPLRPRVGHRPRRLPAVPTGNLPRGEEEEVRRKYWVQRLFKILKELEAPVLNMIMGSRRPDELLLSHLSGRRASTLAARVRAWERYRLWLRSTYGIGHHTAPFHLLDYLLDRRSEPCSRGTLSAVWSALRFTDEILGVPEQDRWTADVNVVSMARGIVSEATPTIKGRATGPANMPLVKILTKLEELVVDDGARLTHRLLGWWMLLSTWASFRYDDHGGLATDEVTLLEDGLDMTIRRSKTTGPDKRVLFRHAVVGVSAWISDRRWIEKGWALWTAFAPRKRDYLVTQFAGDGSVVYRAMGYAEYAGRMRAILADMKDDDGHALGGEFATYLRPHSWRNFLPSALVALGAPADSLRWLSAWRPQSADAYVRTSRARTVHLQSAVGRLLRLHVGKSDPLGERQTLSGLENHLRERNCAEEDVLRITAALRAFSDEAVTVSLWNLVETVSDGDFETPAAAGEASVGADEPMAPYSDDDGAPREEVTGYVIAISRKRGRRCLHKVGLCYRRLAVHYRQYEACGASRPSADRYDDYCRDCWRVSKPNRSSSTAAQLGSDSGSSRRTSSSDASSTESERGPDGP